MILREGVWVTLLLFFVLFPSALSAQPAYSAAVPMRVEYVVPKSPDLQNVYGLVKDRKVLEALQKYYSPFRFPIELTLRFGDCGIANAWYSRPAITLCYEYVKEVIEHAPRGDIGLGVDSVDVVIGEVFYVATHELGHAVFDIFRVPILGNAEDAADKFASYIMLQFGKDRARKLITGAAYSYRNYLQNPEVTAPLAAFSEAHAAPAQRFYNLLCLAYGADPVLFSSVVEKGYLPRNRAKNCKLEYDQVGFAFQALISPHLDKQLARRVLDSAWMRHVP